MDDAAIDAAQERLEAAREVREAERRRANRDEHQDTAARLAAAIVRAQGWVSDEEVSAYERTRERERRAERMRDGGVIDVLTPELIGRVALDALEQTEALDMVRRWVAYQRGPSETRALHGEKPVFALVGNMGRGKTVAAAWLIANEGGRYISSERLSRLQAARFGDEQGLCRRTLSTGVLAIDEIGFEENHGHATAALFDAVNERQGRRLTLLLGNLSKADLAARLGRRTVDRMRTCGNVFELAGDSMRSGTW